MRVKTTKFTLSNRARLIGVVAVITLIAAFSPLINSAVNELFAVDVRYIDINGVDSDEKIDAVNRQLSEVNLKLMSIDQIKSGLEGLPWVHQANIRKVWPDRMDISIQEEVPLARWNDDKYLNTDAVVFASEFSVVTDLPSLVGPDGTERLVMWQFQKLNSVVGVTGKTISYLDLNDRGGWSFQLGDVAVRLGKEDILARMRRFFASL